MTLTLSQRKQVLLAMLGPASGGPPADLIAQMDEGDWLAVDGMASQHRLGPWLHHRLKRHGDGGPVPEPIAERWRAAYRDGAFGALTAQAALVRLAAAFADTGVPMVSLKGGQLAFFAYPEPALRPMRDLDILVSPDDLMPALNAMAAAGCTVPTDREAAVARALNGDKHLDPIALPDCDRYIELHHRIAEPGLPCIDTVAILGKARSAMIGGQAVPYPSPEHMLGHLVLHAAYNHRFDCGPLALVDIAVLAGSETFDLPAFVALARDGGWLHGAQLLLALVEKHVAQTGIDIGQADVPETILAEAETLILQDFDQRAQVLLATQGARDGMAATVLGRLKKGLGTRPEEGRLRWIASRTARTLRQGSDARSVEEAAAGARLARWLRDT
ncbi:nucleotidyltransferase domain-containing protein [Croceicoccus naphthovorans]|uniref:Uncharacterized protein n=1 Tax=Croceicoccus naphthovorans TaxID=1348774 RepID=A0A0G3XBL2_9SPHN|nr:nucleotidyltransferase family protein [Croceicoccus naphthovorans]AKM08950.1 hypothetical protein AB433_01515 [Croceicoccus naphthovorans]MBB3989261.1 hypothetical protein [Croceicoccus naphthovorans]